MSETTQSAKGWEGQLVDGRFPLQQLLGETDHSAVFLTERGDAEGKKKAAIKLVAAEGGHADLLLANWKYAAHLTHPNLLQLFDCGRCSIHGNDVLYLVMEHAEEDLADVLPQRALSAEEARDMLLPVLDALEYLHGKNLVHRDIKPANVLASGDRLKLSSDAISRVAEGLSVPKKTGVYDPPEAITGVLSPAGDVWALGTTLVEVLTQKLPDWQPGPHREPVVPANLPAPFQEIVRHCLRLEPDRRMRIAEIAARLNPRAAAASVAHASAAASVAVAAGAAGRSSTASVAAVPAPRRQPAVEPPVRRSIPGIPGPHASGEISAAPRTRRFMVPLLIVGAVVFAVILTVPRLLTNRPEATANSAPGVPAAQKAAAETPATKPPAEIAPAKAAVKPQQEASPAASPQTDSSPVGAAAAVPADSLKSTSEKDASAPPSDSGAAAPMSPAPAKTAPADAAKGEVLDQVLPEVPQKARDTIQGRVRVGVKVHVDAAGAVTGAELDSPGPSKYFADWALQAARKWAFTPPEVDGKSVESDWILRFVFTQTDTKVTPRQTAP